MAYLGKISAVIAANTQDFTRNIGLAKKELGDFAKKVQGLQLNLNTNALDKTLTKTQRFQREIQAIEKLLAKGVDLGIDPKKLNDQFRAFEDIGKPLTKLKDQIEGLSLSLQAELYPELGKIQAGFRNLYNEIGNGSAEYDKSEKRIESLRLALVRLGRTTAAAADLGKLSQSLDANNAGASFFQPRAKQALQQSLALRGQAEQVPARFRSSAFADLAVSAEENANKIEQQAGRIARIQLEIARRGESRTRLFDLSEAEGQLDALTRRQESINLAFKRQLRGAQIAQVVSPEAQGSVDTLISRLSSLSTQLRAINGQQFEGLISGASRVVAQFNAGETSAKKAKQAVDALASALNSVNTGKTLADKTRSLLFTDSERQRQQIQSDFDRQRAAGDPAADVRRRANLTRLSLNEDIIPRNRQLEASAAETGDVELQRRAQRLSAISRQVSNEIQKAFNLSASGKVEAADQQLAKTNRLIEQQSARYRKLAADIEVANQARSQQNLFLEASGGRGEQLSQGARDAAADISTARQFRGQIASGASRIAIQGEIDRVTASVTSLQREMAKVAASDLKTDEKARKLDQLDNEIRQATKGLAAFVAAQSGGAYNTSQIEKAMQMARNTAGSLSARSSQVAQLAFQQALFAIDDLISSTGGLEYKLRAVGNNITQLGLLLGQSGIIPGLSATTGLFVGLATVIGGQAVSAILRWATGAELADEKTKTLNESLAKQKNLVSELAQAYRSLADSIADRGLSPDAKDAAAFKRQLDDIAKKQKSVRDERILSLDPGVQDARASVRLAQKKLDESATIGDSVIAQRELDAAKAREERASRAALSRGALPAADVEGRIKEALRREAQVRASSAAATAAATGGGAGAAQVAMEREQRAGEARIASVRVGGSNEAIIRTIEEQISGLIERGAPKAEIAGLQALIVNLKTQVELLSNNAVVEILNSAGRVSDSLEAAGESLDRAGVGQGRIRREIESAVERRNRLVEESQRGGRFVESGQAQLQGRAIEAFAARLTSAAASVEQFAAAVDRVAADLVKTVLGETESMASQARRADNAADAAYTAEVFRIPGSAPSDGIQRSRLANTRGFQASDARARAEAELRQQRAAAAQFEVARSRGIQDFERQAAGGGLGREAAALVRQRDGQEAVLKNEKATVEQQQEAANKLKIINERLAAVFEDSDIGRSLAQLADKFDIAAQEFAQREQQIRDVQASAERGRELFVSPELRRSREIAGQLQDSENAIAESLMPGIRSRAKGAPQLAAVEQAMEDGVMTLEEIGGIFDQFPDLRNKLQGDVDSAMSDLKTMRTNLMENSIQAQMARSVENAVLQGPSRAALTASDITTSQGAQELNRLLRGDDAARDADFVEMQKQTTQLQQVNEGIKQLTQKLGVAQ